jgi:hypothetical protein
MGKFEVEVVFRQRAIYRLEAADRQAAERLAIDSWRANAPSIAPGYEWAELETVTATEAADPQRADQDAELILRFLKERERLILKLGADVFSRGTNDAISAAQVAADLGWTRAKANGPHVTDILRATEALESLCQSRRVVCFERPRVRSGERGEIRLYCTPEYLEKLSETLEPIEQPV